MAAKTLQQRFEEKVDRSGGQGKCHEWTASRDRYGYGRLWVDDQMALAHRVAYKLSSGPIPAGLCVLHRCDNPLCVNPLHLFIGTHADNTRDCIAKGRDKRPCGTSHPNAKLTEGQVVWARAQRGRQTLRETAEALGVTKQLISLIQLGRLWRHVKSPD